MLNWIKKNIWNIIIIEVFFFASIGCVFHWGIQWYGVRGSSMLPTIHDNDTCVSITKNFEIERNDIILVYYKGLHLIKRVIGLPGDKVDQGFGLVAINGVIQEEYFLDHRDVNTALSYTLKPNEYWILGDNRAISLDSHIFGPITRDMIIGEVKLRWSSWIVNRY